MDTFRTLFCLRCRRPMVDTTTLCPHCGAEQADVAREVAEAEEARKSQMQAERKRRRNRREAIVVLGGAFALSVAAAVVGAVFFPPAPKAGPMARRLAADMDLYVMNPTALVLFLEVYGQPDEVQNWPETPATRRGEMPRIVTWSYRVEDGFADVSVDRDRNVIIRVDPRGLPREETR